MSVLDRAAQRQAKGETFALATVVRTVSVTAAKAGAKALINSDGSIEEGWIGGGCARAAVLKAARQCILHGKSRLVSIAPKDLLADLGVAPGEDRAGVFYAKNSCPSQGTMDIFVEPVLPSPRLLILALRRSRWNSRNWRRLWASPSPSRRRPTASTRQCRHHGSHQPVQIGIRYP